MPDSPHTKTFVTGSRRGDILLFLFLACLVLVTSYRLRVYFQVTVLKTSVFQISPDGSRRLLPTPDEFHQTWSPHEPSTAISRLEAMISAYMRDLPLISKVKPGTRFEWVIRYSYNSRRLDHQHTIVFVTEDHE